MAIESTMERPAGDWMRSGWAALGASILLPPLGLILVWLRPMGIAKKLLATLGIGVLSVAYLFLFFGLRVELAGSGSRPIFRFGDADSQFERIVESRARQASIPDPQLPPAAAPPVAANEAAPAAEPAPAGAPGAGAPASPAPASAPVVAAYWTDFRGPARDGVYRQMAIRTDWPAGGLKPLWKQPIGGGYASFVFGGGLAYTIEQRRGEEAVTAYDPKTGKEIWAHTYPALFEESMGGPGPRATPTFHDGVVYSMGATGELRVLEARNGELKWKKNILTDTGTRNLQWGMCGSPLVAGGLVVVTPGAGLVAYDRTTGRQVWRSLDDQGGYASPMLATLAGQRQILAMMASRVVAVVPETGKLLWEVPWQTQFDINSAQPILAGENRLIVSSGYGHGAALIELTRSGETITPRVVWQNTRMKNRFNSSVLHNGYIYGLDEGILACVRVSDGELAWKGGRYGYGQLILAGDQLIVLTERGELVLVKATPERHEEVASFDAIRGKTWNVPAIEDGILLVRNAAEMAGFRLSR